MMTLHDFFHEEFIPFIKGDYINFSSKVVDGYSLFIGKWDKVPRQAMVTPDAQILLQRIFEKYSVSTDSKESDLQTSQVSRWYVNSFTLAYNRCRRDDLYHPYKHTDFAQFVEKLTSSDDLNHGDWDFDMFRKYTFNFGRREGTLFYIAEKEACNGKIEEEEQDSQSADDVDASTSDVNNKKNEYNFPEGLLKDIYNNFYEEVFQKVTSLDEFTNILTRKKHSEHLVECSDSKMQMYKLLYNMGHMLSKDVRKSWLKYIAEDCHYKVNSINKKHNGNAIMSDECRKTMELIDHVFSKYSRS